MPHVVPPKLLSAVPFDPVRFALGHLVRRLLVVAALLVPAVSARADEPSRFPLRASDDGRYLVDAQGQPFFVMGDTPWFLQRLPLDDVRRVMDDRLAKGFNTLFLEVLDDSRIPSVDAYGEAAFETDTDITRPREAYWKYAEQVLDEAARRGFFVIHSELWYGAGDGLWMHHVRPENARIYGEFVGRRFARFDNLMWMHCGDRNPDENLARCAAILAETIAAAAPRQLHTVHNAHEFASSAFFHDAPWLDVNLAYTYGAAYRHVLPEYLRRDPVRPLVFGETGYEGEPNAIELLPDAQAGDLWNPYRIRRNAWWGVLSGAMGYCAGTRLWRYEPNWREVLDAESTRQAPLILQALRERPWQRLEPELPPHLRSADARPLVVAGGGAWESAGYVAASRTPQGDLALVYLPEQRPVTLDLTRFAAPVRAAWFDPTDGGEQLAAEAPFDNRGQRQFASPGANAAGEPDWVLILETTPAAE